MFRLTVTEVETLRKGELETMVQSAMALGFFTLFILLVAVIGGLVFAPAWVNVLVLGAMFLGGVAIGLVIWTGIRKARGHPKAFMDWWTEWVAHEIKVKVLPTETTPLPLPTETRVIPVTAGNRVGEVAVYVNGFHPEFLKWWAGYLADGNPTSEARLEKMRLPYQGGMFGGLTDGTPLTRLLDLCEKRGILSPRDKARRKPGTLLIQDEQEIMKLLLFEDKNA